MSGKEMACFSVFEYIIKTIFVYVYSIVINNEIRAQVSNRPL